MKRKMFLTVVAAAAIAVSARAQAVTAPAGQVYTIGNAASATAVNTVTYQWYRDNNPISGATSASYTVPRTLAYGENVQFYRLAKTVDCTGDVEKKSNTVTITFTGYIMPDGCTLVIDGVCWASANIDNPQTFASRADMYTKFYQWNRLTAYSADDPLTPAWNTTMDSSETWTVNPCPPNWRIPSRTEYQLLHSSGSTWANENTRGNQIGGRFYGPSHATCSLPNNMSGCAFFPASGSRNLTTGALTYGATRGFCWSSTQASNTNGYYLDFNSSTSTPASSGSKAYSVPIRCVR